MQPQPADYYDKINNAVDRRVTAEVILSTADPTHIQKTSFVDSSPQEERISVPTQLYNQLVRQSYGWMTLEKDRITTDGKFCIYDYGVGGEFGWIGAEMCDENGAFENPQFIELSYIENMTFHEFSVYFDYWANEYATAFTLTFYDFANNIIEEVEVTDNNSYQYVFIQELNFVRRVRLTMTAWSKGLRRAKVTDILSGNILIFGGDDLISLETIENNSVHSDSVIASEMTVTVQNFDKKFNVLNPQGISQKLTQKQVVSAYITVGGGTVQVAQQYLDEWSSPDKMTEFKCLSSFGFIKDDYIPESHQLISAYDLFVKLFQKSNIESYNIDSSLHNIQINQYVKGLSLRQAIQQLANAVNCVVFPSKSGAVVVDTIASKLRHTGLSVTFDNFEDVPTATQYDSIDSITASIFQYSEDTENGVQTLVENMELEVEETLSVYVEYGKIATGVTVTAEGATLVSHEDFADRTYITLSGTGTAKVTVTGTEVIQKISKIETRADSYNYNPIKNSIIIENQFICLVSQARLMSNSYLEIGKYRIENDTYERGRPDIDCGDLVTAENEFGIYDGIVFEQSLLWDGYLSGNLKINAKRANE